jgi:DNA-binding IclR family transcriptional regulator
MALCVDRVRAAIPNVEAAWFAVGAKTTLNGGGGPRTHLAFLPEEERARVLSLPIVNRTPASVLDVDTLRAQADVIKLRGWDLAETTSSSA